jgi:hypothetical protein
VLDDMRLDGSILSIEIGRSPAVAGVLGLFHLLALAAAWTSLSGLSLFLVLGGVLASMAASVVRALNLQRDAAKSLELHADGRVFWGDGEGVRHAAELDRGHYVSPLLVVVDLRPLTGGRKRVMLAADAVRGEDMRRLRVWLRWRHAQPSGPAGSSSGERTKGRNNLTQC